LADPDKGSGIAMICTFGDLTDVIWWRELDLPVRSILGRDGRILPTAPEGVGGPYDELVGKTGKQAQKLVVEMLRASGDLDGEPRPITHPVKFYEKGDRPLEVVTSRQWYIRNGGRDMGLRDELLTRGKELVWHPPHMHARYENWVTGLNGDWLISRQRFFGVPIPLWYRVDEAGEPVYDEPIVPAEEALPVDPSSDTPPGYTEDQRGRPGGFTGDADVMDTWATSSLTPQIAGRWEDDPELFGRVFPMDLRPQGPEIIRTWLFATVVRAHLEHGSLPWRDTTINGWVLDPDRKKMSKSKGNVVTPLPLLEEYGSDAVRYWACSGRPGTDTAVDFGQLKVGRRLATKLLNASKFVLTFPEVSEGEVTEALDLAMLRNLSDLVVAATEAFEGYDYARALERTETFFWTFCDDYIELVKGRAYSTGSAAESALRALRIAMDTLLRLFAPFLAFAAEEVWSWWRTGSVHQAEWPTPTDVAGDPELLAVAGEVLADIRKEKSAAKTSMRTGVDLLVVTAPAQRLDQIKAAQADIVNAGVVTTLELREGEPSVQVTLAAPADG
jgi:valyl-tRNA synthetase